MSGDSGEKKNLNKQRHIENLKNEKSKSSKDESNDRFVILFVCLLQLSHSLFTLETLILLFIAENGGSCLD